MVKLNTLSPAALEAALRSGTAAWGQWGSAAHHVLYVETIPTDRYPKRNRQMCRCGCRQKVTHSVMANGVCLSQGCEMRAHRFVKEMGQRHG